MKKVSERIDEHVRTRAAKAAALAELLEKSENENRVLNDDERKTYDEIEAQVKDIDETISRLRTHEALVARSASPIIAVPKNGPTLAKGIGMARMVQLIMASRGNDEIARKMAQQHFPDQSEMARLFEGRSMGAISRAAVPAATTTDAAWAGVLAYQNQLSGELIELVRAESILGRLTGLRQVPFNVRIPRETAVIGSAGWVGQGASKPVGRGSYDFVTVPFTKAALIVAFTEELARFSDPSAEALLRDGLVQAISTFLDQQFIGTAAAVANVSPAGILNSVDAGMVFSSSGPTYAHMQWDIAHAVGLLNGTTGARSPAWIMNPVNKIALGAMPNVLGQPLFPTVNANGTLAGYPVVASAHVPADIIVLIDQQKILHAADSSVSVDASREASIQLDSAPATPPTPLVSLWQQNMIGLRAEKFEYWMRANEQAVVLIEDVAYTTSPPPAPVEP